MSDEGKALVRRMYEEVWNEGRLDVVDDICAPDYRGVGPYGDEHGPDAVKRGVAARRAAFPDIQVTIEDLLVDGDRVSARLTFEGTHQGSFQGHRGYGQASGVVGHLDIPRRRRQVRRALARLRLARTARAAAGRRRCSLSRSAGVRQEPLAYHKHPTRSSRARRSTSTT